MGQIKSLEDLLGDNGLAGFKIVEMTEVYTVWINGRKTSSAGFVSNEVVAKAFIKTQIDSYRYRIRQALVLTNGTIGFRITATLPIRLLKGGKAVV